VRAIRDACAFLVGTAVGLYSIATGSTFGWVVGIALVAGSFFLVRRWWLPRSRGRGRR
jgi:hypothetical protein